jgi:hypothetical protein
MTDKKGAGPTQPLSFSLLNLTDPFAVFGFLSREHARTLDDLSCALFKAPVS